jgi:cytochrome c-type biogenesis protein CcmH
MKRFLLAFLLLLTLLGAIPVWGQQEVPVSDNEVNEVASELFCPLCENTPLDACPTQACKDWRELIRTQLAEGRTEQEIKDYFVAQYGPSVLAEPPTSGFNLVVWLLPLVAVVVGAVFFIRYLRGLQQINASGRPADRPGAATPNGSGIAQDDYVARIEQEVQRDS